MERAAFVAKIAELLGAKQEVAEIAINATLAEVVAPRIWGAGEPVGFFDNSCTNNCKEEIARLESGVSPLARR